MSSRPWQLDMFDRSLKKRQKLAALKRFIGDPTGNRCLLVTCGDNNGAMNYHFRAMGGTWIWADVLEETIPDMERLLGEPVHHVNPAELPFQTGSFDIVISIDVLEHLQDDQPFLQELARVTAPSGLTVVTVPGGEPRKLANRLKFRIGMTPEQYGHTRLGYTIDQLRNSVQQAGLAPTSSGSYSGLITESIELGINYGYIFFLSRKNGGRGGNNSIAPSTEGDFKAHGAAYQAYRLAFPVLRAVSSLDRALFFMEGYAVIVAARRPAESASFRQKEADVPVSISRPEVEVAEARL